MARYQTILAALLLVILLINVPSSSAGLGLPKGGRGTSAVTEILAAGLVAGLLMDNRAIARPMLRFPFLGRFNMMPRHPMPRHPMPHHPMPNMMPVIPYAMPSMHRPQFLMNHQALMAQASRHQALTARLNDEIRALAAQESILQSMLTRNQQGSDQALNQLLEDEDAIPAAALLLETAELVSPEVNLEHPHPIPHPGMFEMAGSEPQSRYILPRIVRHFVQRIMRKGERH